ncbi:hypothetical protein K505DRAFT_320176 [Melanomma pulvis-pyrius CBS 109.77]|uniref:NADH-ubiquinone oxidoreductase 213 kDa subunit n=1 Tax=Melanomma pulvis-pyrius CBS 109.77 TaxID=1314802 RepID=A0A6A6XWN7_9PLEO|nr:hypothetical protein K505DRAFT_320176 [Melanomma pulvis-pyrius CBS 109.77]
MAEREYIPQDTLSNTGASMLQTTAAGAIFAGVQNTLRKQNVGAMGIITRSGHIIAIYAGVGAAYQFTRDSAANLRRKEDAYNEALGGFAGGAVVGLAKRSIPFMLGMGTCTAAAMFGFRYTNGFTGYKNKNSEVDEVEAREAVKKLYRQPLQETIEQLGEGRGIYAPGYEERRRERLLAKYGVDVGAAQGTK